MRIFLAVIVFLATIPIMDRAATHAHELYGYAAIEGRGFFTTPLFEGQKRNNGSLTVQAEYYHEWENGSIITFVPFGRLDSSDSERSHFDIRELNYLWLSGTWELRVGIGKVFWGATEFVHLADIINQTDLVEAIDQEEKLGQPMIKFSLLKDWGLLDFFVLPWFRERTFPGRKGRLRFALAVDTDSARYENGDQERHIDLACRYSQTLGAMDIGVYHFVGTGREPTLLPELDNSGLPHLVPFYEQINQTGMDLQLVASDWLWKLEAIYRTGQGEDFFSAVGGLEYTLVGIGHSKVDIGLIAEWAYDDRNSDSTTPFDNDVMFGLRVAVNDVASTELLAGLLLDADSAARTFTLEASRRLGTSWTATLETYVFANQTAEDILYDLRDDDYVSLTLAYYF